MRALRAAIEPAFFELERFPCLPGDGLDMPVTTGVAEQCRWEAGSDDTEGTLSDPSVGLPFSFERPLLPDSLSIPTPLRGPPGPEKKKTEARYECERPPSLAYASGNICFGDCRRHLVPKSIVSDNTS